MDSIGLIKTLRYLFANDSTIKSYLGVSTLANALIQIPYQDGILAKRINGEKYPVIALKLDDDESTLRGSDSNTAFVTMVVINYINNSVGSINWLEVIHKLKDKMKLLIRDNHESINTQAIALSLNLKVRDSLWVGGVTYDDKTQGTEDLHKIICTTKFIIGD